ncbi:PEP-CTERM sorting domain-containing protein [Pseudoduganella sp. GCM10020061]|uniref:PEP-CTERM sorting domain-containing protein n=1 Tax=Pseudoduganella sp. GCM10020061 TaxID=3317345 RepID=UPI003630F97B
MKRALSICALAVASLGASSAANAQVTFQGVTFTPSWSGNVLTLEIDAANPTGDWSTAEALGALHIKSIGSWDSVVMSGPGSAGSWTIVNNELNANGCVGGGGGGNQSACASGSLIPLTDDMVFQFTFTGGSQDFSMPHIKVQMFEMDGERKVGSLMSLDIPAIPEPSTYAMLLGGLGLLAVARRNAKKNAA